MADPATAAASTNAMDVWVQASLQGLIKFMHEEMEAYRLYTVVPRLVRFIGDLTNWYVRLNRRRLKGDDGDAEAHTGLCCLYEVLLTMAVMMAPFTPFFAEFLYQRLRPLHPAYGGDGAKVDAAGAEAANGAPAASAAGALDALGSAASVHYLMLPRFDPARLDPAAEAETRAMQQVIELGRAARDKRTVSLKTPVKQVIVVCKDLKVLSGLRKLMGYVKSELNAWEVELTEEVSGWCSLSAQVNMAVVGKRLGKKTSSVQKAFRELSEEAVMQLEASGCIEVEEELLQGDEIRVLRAFKGDAEKYEAAWEDGDGDGCAAIMVVLDICKDDRVVAEQLARSIVNRVQKLRKKAGLTVGDPVEVFFEDGSPGAAYTAAVVANLAMVRGVVGTPLPSLLRPPHAVSLVAENSPLEGAPFCVELTLPALSLDADALAAAAAEAGVEAAVPGRLLASLDYGALRAAAAGSAGGETVVWVDGKRMALRHGRHYFWDALELARAKEDKRLSWAFS
ncbi:unnamed protein product [Phaeothamnion confervicola]